MTQTKTCAHCGAEFSRPRTYGPKQWAARLTCSQSCGSLRRCGGRTLGSNGYWLIWVGVGHHLAHKGKGYAYEHRVVAEKKLGRRLRATEQVHHINGVKTDNRPENLEVLTSEKHKVRHRRLRRGLRDPGQPNPTVRCACGCGDAFLKFDDWGRPRRFADPAHKPRRRNRKGQYVGERSDV